MPNTNKLQADFKGLNDWVEIFRAGTQTDSAGNTRQFTQADLDQVIANHDPEHPAPHVITHKEMYSPFAYGQSSELKREGDSLYVKSTKIEPQFEALVKNGNLFERSIRLLPTDNGFKLGHIAWLGAEPPAVEGMAPVSFNANEQGLDFMMDTRTPNLLAKMMRNMRDFLIEQFGKEKADEVMPDWDIDSLNRHIADLENDEEQQTNTQFSKNNKPGDGIMSEFTQADIDAAKAKGAADAKATAESDFAKQQSTLQQQLDSERAERKQSEFSALVKSHIDRGVAPADIAGAADFMMSLDKVADGAFEFSQGTGDKAQTVKTSQLDFVKGLLDKIPATVNTRQTQFDDVTTQHADFNAPAGTQVDADNLALHNKALDYQREHPNTPYITAVQLVTQQEQR
ncbi:MAG: hypothetical protein GQ532_00325 [Methylomarinum sp.]|nr:hypothetical protein [Methylomarinum sp.]